MKKWIRMLYVLAILTVTAVTLAACKPTTVFPSNEETESEEETETEDPNTEMAFIFRYRDNVFERVTTYMEAVTEQTVLDKLIEYGVLEDGTEILSFEVEGDTAPGPGAPEGAVVGPGGVAGQPQNRVGTLNLSKVPAWPAEVEEVMLKCLGNTFVDNFQLNELKLLVNGENYSGASITLGDDDYLGYESGYKNVSE